MSKAKKIVERGWAIKAIWGHPQYFFPKKLFETREEARIHKKETPLSKNYKIVLAKIMEE